MTGDSVPTTAATRDAFGVPLPGTDDPTARAELAALTPAQLRRRRELLGAELRALGQWRRLLRARRELLVATVVVPAPLLVPVEAAAEDGPLERHLDDLALSLGGPALPGEGLADLVYCAPGPQGVAPALAALVDAERRLAAYAEAVAAELETATEVLVAQVRADIRTDH
ncbi:hypothetical protein ACFFKU_13800 [Kineococcus gynurae]|uniref:Uncharacterized protein n=1 Tax=Kineococcus gynurae TaxID=452979 RepID=A0ABV5LU96_9ACTN